MNLLHILLFSFLAQAASAPQSTASVEGIVVKLGTAEPIAGVDVELTRVEGTTAAPLPPGAAEVLARALVGGGNQGPLVPREIASEVQYAKTGTDGKFAFKNLKEGKYRLAAVRVGGAYQPAEYGQRDPRGRGLNFPVAVGQAVRDAKLEMAPTGTITGRITDANGQPLGHVRVSSLAPLVQNGRRYLTVMNATHTDERGEFRLFWLSPGRYYIAARLEDLRRRTVPILSVPPGRAGTAEAASAPVVARRRAPNGDVHEETTALVYYGGVVDPDQARPIEIAPGATFAGADISMVVGKMPSWHIRGVVVDSTNKPIAGANIRAIPRQWSPNVLVLNGSADANGAFDLGGAVQGSYAVYAAAAAVAPVSEQLAAGFAAAGLDLGRVAPWVTSELGYAPVDIGNADANNIRISTTRGIPIAGRVSIEGRPRSDKDPDLAKVRTALVRDPNILTMPVAMITIPPPPPVAGAPAYVPLDGLANGDGTFRFLAAPGDFRVRVTDIPSNSYVKSIRMGNVDVLGGGLQVNGPLDTPLEVVIGIDGGQVAGSVLNDRQEPMANAVVALVPDSPLLRRRFDLYRSGTTDHAGKFRLQTIPPGTYKLFSWDYADTDAWQDAQFLQAYETSGRTITIREGSTQDVQLRMIPTQR